MTLRDLEASTISVPAALAVDPAMLVELESEAAANLDLVVHTNGLSQPAGSGWLDDLREDAPGAVLRDVVGAPLSDAGEIRLDYGSPDAQEILPTTLHRDLARDVSANGIYLDGVGSGRGEPGYDPHEAPTARAHIPHGGAYGRQGTRRLLNRTRSEIKAEGANGHVLATAAQEGILGQVDIAEESIDSVLPLIGEFLELYRDGGQPIEKTGRASSPPHLAQVHAERASAGRIISPLNRAALATSIWHPHAIWPGLSTIELNRMLALQVAACVVCGYTPILSAPPTLSMWAMGLGDDEPVLELVRQAFDALTREAWIAPYLRGRADVLPMTDLPDAGDDAGDDAGGLRESYQNPLSYLRQVNPEVVGLVGPVGMPRWTEGGDHGDDMGDDMDTDPPTSDRGLAAFHLPFLVPRVLARMWRRRGSEDRFLVLANWTETPAPWHGKFVPVQYGWAAGQAGDDAGDDAMTGQHFRIDRLVAGQSDHGDDAGDDMGNPDATEVPMESDLSGPVLVDCSGIEATRSPSGAVLLGLVPAFRIQTYRFRQEP